MNCLVICQNNSKLFNGLVKHYFWKDKAPYEIFIVYDPLCGEIRNELEQIIDLNQNINFKKENIFSIEDIYLELKNDLYNLGLNDIGFEFIKIFKMRSKILGVVSYFKLIKKYDIIMTSDEDTFHFKNLQPLFDLNAWVFKNYGMCSFSPELDFSEKLTEEEQNKILKTEKIKGLGLIMERILKYDVFNSSLKVCDLNSCLINGGFIIHTSEFFDNYLKFCINFYNHKFLYELYKNALTKTYNNQRNLPTALWLIEEYFHKFVCHFLIQNNARIKPNECQFVIAMISEKYYDDYFTKLKPMNVLSHSVIHYIVGKRKQHYHDNMTKFLDDLNWQGNRDLRIFEKKKRKIKESQSKYSKYIQNFTNIIK